MFFTQMLHLLHGVRCSRVNRIAEFQYLGLFSAGIPLLVRNPPSMEHYSLDLVRAAVIARLPALQVGFEKATQFKQHATSGFFFPRLNLSMEQLRQLTPDHSGGRNHPSLKDLRFGLASARQIGEVEITSFEKKRGYSLTATSAGDTFTKKDIKKPEQVGLLFAVRAAKLEDPSSILGKRCRWAPLTWNINPKRLVHRLTKKDIAKDCKVVMHRESLELTGRLVDIEHRVLLRDADQYEGLNYLAWRPETRDSKLLGLKNGVTYPLEFPGLAQQVFCLIDCHELELNERRSGFVPSEALNGKLGIIQKALEHARSLVC
jgi:hypothetical protein